jgi:hypothetical protein
VPRKFVMLYVASLLCQPHRAGAKASKNRATQPDDVVGRPTVPVTDGARQVVWLGKSNHKKRRPPASVLVDPILSCSDAIYNLANLPWR